MYHDKEPDPGVVKSPLMSKELENCTLGLNKRKITVEMEIEKLAFTQFVSSHHLSELCGNDKLFFLFFTTDQG